MSADTDRAAAIQSAAQEMQQQEGRFTAWFPLDGGRAFRAKLEPDNDMELDPDNYGAIHWSARDSRARPAACDGAARKLRTRQGPAWWQPTDEMKKEPAFLASAFERTQAYFLESWAFCGVIVETRGKACACCGETKSTTDSVWGIETDAGDYFAEVLADLIVEAGHA